MFTASADLYDLIYGSFKNYQHETGLVCALVHARHPQARSLLDVACGTGEHAKYLRTAGYEVDGLDLDRNMLAVAERKNPGSHFFAADMCAFRLPNRYDVVLCLFSSIGYARTIERVAAALTCFRYHLQPGGLVVVEPWFEPSAVVPGRTETRTVEGPGVVVTRRSRSTVDGRLFRLTFEYDLTRGGETTHASEDHELGLFTRSEMEGAFASAGLTVDYDPAGPSGRGLYLAQVAA